MSSGTVYVAIIDMKRRFINIIFIPALIAICFAGNATGQAAHSTDWTLSMLRGSWKFHTFEDKWTLDFLSDHNLVSYHNPKTIEKESTILNRN